MQKLQVKKDLELKILSAMIFDADSVPYISQRLKSGDFTNENSLLFDSILQLTETENYLRVFELSKKNIQGWSLTQLNQLDKDLNFEWIIANNILQKFLDLVLSFSIDEFLKDSLSKNENDFSGLDSLSELQDKISELQKRTLNFVEDKSFSENLTSIYAGIQEDLDSKTQSSFTVKNIPSFNTATGGLRAGNLVAIAGSFKSGKTTLGLNLLVDFAKQNIPVGLFSLELSELETSRKILAMLSGIPYEKLREPKKLDESEKKRLLNFEGIPDKLPLYVYDLPSTENDIKAKAKYWKERFNVKVVCIDYLGYIQSKRKFETRERELSYYSGFLKQLAKELNIIVIALAQLNRQGKENPTTTNLAESISLARDCDFLFVVFNPSELQMKQNGEIYPESNFFCKLDTSRHTKFKKSFLLNLKGDGNFIELVSEYQNDYQNISINPKEDYLPF